MEKTAKLYVAGHTGLVGSAIVTALRKHGYENIVTRTHKDLDLKDARATDAFFAEEKPEYVILAAARAGGIRESIAHPVEFLFENLAIQNSVIGAAHTHGAKKLLFIASSCMYPRECPQPMKEEYLMTGPLEPTNEGYAIAKMAGVKLCQYISAQFGKKFISCIPCNIYGEGDYFDTLRGHVIGSLMVRMHAAKTEKAETVSVWGTGNARREFLFDEDLAEAIVRLLENYEGEDFMNVGSGTDISIRELAELMKKTVGYEGNIVFDSSKPDGMPRKLLDVSKIEAFGWHHKIGLEAGLTRSYAAYLKKLDNPNP
jgi:GDP-L-fucose synthase